MTDAPDPRTPQIHLLGPTTLSIRHIRFVADRDLQPDWTPPHTIPSAYAGEFRYMGRRLRFTVVAAPLPPDAAQPQPGGQWLLLFPFWPAADMVDGTWGQVLRLGCVYAKGIVDGQTRSLPLPHVYRAHSTAPPTTDSDNDRLGRGPDAAVQAPESSASGPFLRDPND